MILLFMGINFDFGIIFYRFMIEIT